MRVFLGQADHAEATTVAHLSGCGLSAIIRSNSCAVYGPLHHARGRPFQMRFGRYSWYVIACPRRRLRKWEATSVPLRTISTVNGVERISTTSCTKSTH
jgi:hypothetical protein